MRRLATPVRAVERELPIRTPLGNDKGAIGVGGALDALDHYSVTISQSVRILRCDLDRPCDIADSGNGIDAIPDARIREVNTVPGRASQVETVGVQAGDHKASVGRRIPFHAVNLH